MAHRRRLHKTNDIIPVVSGIPLCDIPPSVVARRLKRRSSAARARFFNNIGVASIEALSGMIESAEKGQNEQAAHEFVRFATAVMADTIRQTIEKWGETQPKNIDNACVYAASDSSFHRMQARSFFRTEEVELAALRQWPGLMVLRNARKAIDRYFEPTQSIPDGASTTSKLAA